MRQTPWWLLWLLPLACEEAIERPAPLTLAASGAVQPRHACPTQVVEVRGGGFSPAIAPNDDDALEISLPTLRLEGAAGRYEVDPVKGSALRWRSDEEMALSLPQDMTTGVYDLTLSAPGADPAAEAGALWIIAPPQIDALRPSLLCLSQGARELQIEGARLLHLGDAPPQISLGALTLDLAEAGACEDASHAEAPGLLCPGGALTLAEGALPPGQHAVSAQNPAPADCASDANRTLTVVEAPQVLAASPGLICPNEGDAQVRFTLSDALEIDGEISAFELTNLSGERAPLVGDWADCEAIEAQDHEVRRCATFTARIPQETPDQHYRPTLTVTPPSEALCGFEGRGALWILPPPVITAVGPQFICLEGDEVTLEIEGEGVFQIDGVAPEIRIGDAAPRAQRLVSCAPLEIPGASVLRCAKVQVTYDRATLDSGAPLTLRNPPPADCATEASYDLNIIEPPRIDNATPQMACGAVGEITIEIEGASFFQAPGNEETGQPARLPRVVINGRAIPPAQLTTQGCQGVGAADQGWSRCDQISVSLDLSVYDPGILSVEVTNPAPTQCGEPAVTQLVVLPPVGIARVTPPEVCGEDDPVPITLSGQGFISLDGAPPTVRVAGQAIPATVDECEDLPGAPITDAQGAEVCRTLRLAVIPSALPAGPALIEVENPGELACVGQAQGLFMPIAPPIIEAVRPEVVCGGVERSLEITGGGFIEAAEVRLGDAEGEVDFIDASALSARFGAEVMVEGLYDLRVRNAVGCEATIEEAVEVMAQPQIVGIEPPTASNAADTPARLITSGLREPVASVTLLGPEGATARLNGQSSAEDPNLIDVIIPSGLVAGDWQARVVSRAGCVGLVGGALEITEGAP